MVFPTAQTPAEVGSHVLFSPATPKVVLKVACRSVGTLYPILSTVKAIESGDKNDCEQQLSYWAVYGSFSIAEIFSDKLLAWFPFYYHAKLAFFIWLQLPACSGSRHLYVKYLQPFLSRYQEILEQIVHATFCEANKILVSWKQLYFVKVAFQTVVFKALKIANKQFSQSLPSADETTGDDSVVR